MVAAALTACLCSTKNNKNKRNSQNMRDNSFFLSVIIPLIGETGASSSSLSECAIPSFLRVSSNDAISLNVSLYVSALI